MSLELSSFSMQSRSKETPAISALSSAFAQDHCGLGECTHITQPHTDYGLVLCSNTEGSSHDALFYTSGGGSTHVLVAGSPDGCVGPQWERNTSFQALWSLGTPGNLRTGHLTRFSFLIQGHLYMRLWAFGLSGTSYLLLVPQLNWELVFSHFPSAATLRSSGPWKQSTCLGLMLELSMPSR